MRKLKNNKRAGADIWFNNWPELLSFVFLVVGGLLALSAGSAFVSYIIIFIAGIVIGRIWYKKRDDLKVPVFLAILGFLIGYLAGASIGYGDKRAVVVFFFFGLVVSYYLHHKGYIRE